MIELWQFLLYYLAIAYGIDLVKALSDRMIRRIKTRRVGQ